VCGWPSDPELLGQGAAVPEGPAGVPVWPELGFDLAVRGNRDPDPGLEPELLLFGALDF
jgi:hypothetical protein